MGLVQTIQSLSQIGWLGTPGQDSANSKSTGGRPRTSNPAGAQTPEEALAYIKLLYKAGRTGELVALLRRSPVFREAWQTLQQFSSTGSEEAGGLGSSIPAAATTQSQSGLPAPPSGAGPNGQLAGPGQAPTALQVAATPGFSGENPAAQAHPVLSSRPTRPLAAARQVYETQARYYAQERATSPRISLRV
ncbi:MAG: hypothetical protein HY790_12395 [Deltaproteobacteria bacterium]|nr:hypothetical protein [Deltaproteobacteria bacterium]MBI4796614.1 hypothetical protein [Deltaproteobacteria bacterium]